ncbi:helix-turn-helix domain-containing protein [Spirosoma endbachense]|uniref:Helix-turn-helix domain-containing protein n=1 Tax=Spirosoma endbachense TaxID=2666025 RepID=A0A6P1VPU6_9BACT|nr:helix-turn-helix transcriptional regulator [Spirosoma endbachense]QHV94725.1 helix-turn-helix domain-containing protein [Spirosoma endbachense]
MTLVSDNIRYLRKLNGLTQEQFSRKINIKRSLLGAYEEGRANPNQQNIQAIAKAFNTTVELLTRQDLRKIRETPSLSIPLGQSNKTVDARPNRSDSPHIRSDGHLDAGDDDPFQHPDFPDIFSQPASKTPEPQPLSTVLNKYYRPSEEPRPVPTPPVITAPVRPTQERPIHERTQPVTFQTTQDTPAPSPMDRLFGQPDNQPVTPPPPRQPEQLTFNNVYEGSGRYGDSASARSTGAAQVMAPTISIVMQSQFGDYSQRYQQFEFLHRLPAMHLPTLPDGHYRAFEAGDDFVFPGALLIGQFVRSWFEIADGKMYVLLIHHQRPEGSGIVCRRVYNQVKIKGSLLLTADKAEIPNREVALKEVMEVWEIRAFVSQHIPPPAPSTDRLKQLVDELRFEVDRL